MITAVKNIFKAQLSVGVVFALVTILAAGFIVFILFFSRDTSPPILISDTSLPPAELDFGPIPALHNFDFFTATKTNFIQNEADFIEANLSDMMIRVYLSGKMEYEAPILTKGREGSWWETPAGIYRVESKIRNHFSSFGQVYLPWSLPFHGNFFIHGWPHRPDGTPVASAFSGGCIRLANDVAKKIFGMAYVGMPIIVFENDFVSDNFLHRPNKPELTANAYLVADLNNHYVFLKHNHNAVLPIASITKMMTSLVVVGHINLDHHITVPENAIIRTSKPRLRKGESFSAYNLLFPLILESSNEAAETLASRLGRSRFITLMNKKAASIGMSATQFDDPSGLSAKNTSSAEDLFNFTRYIYHNRSFILKIASGRMMDSAYGRPVFRNLENYNLFGADPSFFGGKTGQTTAAGETFLGVFEIEFSGQTRPIAVIVLGSQNSRADIEQILSWLKSHY